MATDFLSLGTTGLASTLRWWYFNAAAQVYNNSTGLFETWTDANYANYQVAGVTEVGTTGTYELTTPIPVALLPFYRFEVHRVVGGTPSTDPLMGEGEQEPLGGVTTQPGTPLPSTRRLYFRLKVAGVYTDPTGNTVTLRDPTQTFGVKRQDTGAIVVGVSPLQTYVRESVGSYYYEIAETGLALLYGAEYIDPSTSALVRQLMPVSTAPPAQAHYASEADVDLELGKDNADIWASLASTGEPTEIAAVREDALRQSDNRVNRRLGAYSPPPAEFPVTSTVAWVTDDIRTAATKYAAGILLNKRDRQSRAGTATEASPGDRLIADGDAILQGVIDAGMLGIALEPEDDTPAPGSFEFVPIVRDACTSTGDENARPLLWY